MGLIKTYFMPNDYVQSVFQIEIEKLANSGFKGIITDLDNTLVGWDVKTPTKEIQEWFKKANDLGLTITIVSNNNEKRVSGFSKDLDVDFIFKARKPMGRAFKKAIQHMNIKPEETIVIGDQMLTDVLGGNNNGLYTIMVVPVKTTDGFLTRLNRIIERRLLNYFKRKGYITWEEN
ncbi:YqeG family HAD IIIA-type phosphatase [Staphylococcus hominis]|uniref:YqeG family HAD IIIA-type phosphatase n=1 Tax=Staphylococcus hominis TaxID=1290 RepID=UPI001F598892|nr:YqeG family HAD IIIA-type phosphatase [Staphylococcus hominis]MCI2922681.1 YqeG family HAD IIIA-type phosphatase [Staphylococcus hominis]MDS3912590.1 YqeG family HAD IIIA-type phosphatase [Staphylococcus hominis]